MSAFLLAVLGSISLFKTTTDTGRDSLGDYAGLGRTVVNWVALDLTENYLSLSPRRLD